LSTVPALDPVTLVRRYKAPTDIERRLRVLKSEIEIARRIQHHQVSLNARPWAAGITTLSPEQQELFAAVGLPPPTAAAL
jgi:hypothetical protein